MRKTAEFANSVDPDEAASLGLHCLFGILLIHKTKYTAWLKHFLKFCRRKLCRFPFAALMLSKDWAVPVKYVNFLSLLH